MKNSLVKLIDKRLGRYLPAETKEPKILHEAMRYSVFSGGKRIRPVIVIEACKACGGQVDNAVPAACAIELVHTFSLIHDDLPSMDDDDYRRGKPSCHKAFGEANAILAGNALLTLAFNLVAANYKLETCRTIVKELSEALGTEGMVGGQALDIEFKDKRVEKKTKMLINRLKTAKLFEASARIGAIAAGANAKKVLALSKYGANLGEVFQITDDIIDGESGFSVKDAGEAVKRAKESLRVFGKSADRLKIILDLILARTE